MFLHITSPKHPGSHKRATRESSGSPGADFDCVNGLALPSSTVHPEFVSPPSSDQDIHQPDTYHAVFHYLLLHALDLERSYLMAIDQRPNSRGETAVNTSIGFLCVAAFFVLTRCFARFGIQKTWGSDDLVIICALALSLVLTILIAEGSAPFSPLPTFRLLTFSRGTLWHGPALRLAAARGV